MEFELNKNRHGQGQYRKISLTHLLVCFFFCISVFVLSLGATWARIEYFLYPLHYEGTIVAASRSAEVSPYLVAGVILAESSFNTEAQSEVGAQGLMQLMPDTAWWIAESHSIHVKERSNSRLREPELNIYLGAYYLSWLLKRFDNKSIEALAAYNAGQHEVDSWIEKRQKPLTINDIPVSETRFFVKKVLNNAEKYSKLYPQLAPLSSHDISRVEENGKEAK